MIQFDGLKYDMLVKPTLYGNPVLSAQAFYFLEQMESLHACRGEDLFFRFRRFRPRSVYLEKKQSVIHRYSSSFFDTFELSECSLFCGALPCTPTDCPHWRLSQLNF